MSTIGIIDYGLGNKASVAGAVERLGHDPVITAEPARLASCDKLILPGVGAFGDGMGKLRERGLVGALDELVLRNKKPILGICLGAQLICQSSDEFGMHDGLGWAPAQVRRIRPANPTLRVPHVGWNELAQVKTSRLLDGVPADALVYYVHSHCILADDSGIVTAVCDYGLSFVAAFEFDNIYASQFHPEKSQRHGLAILGNFLRHG